MVGRWAPQWLSRASFLIVMLCSLLASRRARAETLQAPIGGKTITLGDARVACAVPSGGWVIDPASLGHGVRPPDANEAIGTSVDLKVATSPAACATTTSVVKLVATQRWPVIDSSSTTLQVEPGKVDVRGHRLTGMALAWRSNTASGVDVCEAPKFEGAIEHCTFDVARGLPADPASGNLSFVPAGGRPGADVRTFDSDGKLAPPESFVLAPARVLLGGVVPPDASIDLSTGRGEVELLHPEAIASVDCGNQRCELAKNALLVRSLSSNVSSVDVKFKLIPGVFVSKGSATDATPTAHLAVVHCPMSVVSGPPLRDTESARLVVRVEGRCADEVPSLRFLIGSDSAAVLASQVDSTGIDVLLRVGSTDAAQLSITAVHSDDPNLAVAVTRTDTVAEPQSSGSLEIPGHKNLNFIPTNRPAIVHLPVLADHAHLVPIPVAGVYSVQRVGREYAVTGDPNAAGLTALRLAYRNDSLPGGFADVDLAQFTSPVQRAIHEANLPAPIGGSALGPNPIVEFVCDISEARPFRVMPGVTAHLPFESRDNCRLIFHRDRLSADYGTQKLNLEVDVIDSDGGARGEGHLSETIVMRPGGEPIYAWINGVKAPFDRVIVRLSHAADEQHYVGGLEIQTGAPEVKWTAILGTGRARLYATTTIPTGLYRFGDSQHSGVLSLNFGIVSRLTWLSADGHEGFLGLEGGIMAIGLTNDKSDTGKSLTQVGLVAGIGLSVPIANRSTATQASINLHGWVEEDISHNSGDSQASRSAIIFGPSISIGNVGTNL